MIGLERGMRVRRGSRVNRLIIDTGVMRYYGYERYESGYVRAIRAMRIMRVMRVMRVMRGMRCMRSVSAIRLMRAITFNSSSLLPNAK